MKATGNLIVDLTFQYALDVVKFTDKLEQMKKFSIATQLTKSGTSIGANVRESQSCESTEDFVHKLKISEKELEETEYWLDICKYSDCLLDPGKLIDDLKPIKKVLGKIIATSKKNISSRNRLQA
jgi:four helix bundle protein